MKKHIKWMLFILICIIIVGADSTSVFAKTNKVVKVKIEGKYGNYKQWHIISGVDKSGKTIWKYRTKKYVATELDATTCKVYKNSVIIFENGKFRKLDKQTGKVIIKGKKTIIPAYSITFTCDKNGNIYAAGYYDNSVYKISPKGKVLWKTNVQKTEKYWPYKLKFSNGKLKVWYDGSLSPGYIIFKGKNGKIIKNVITN